MASSSRPNFSFLFQSILIATAIHTLNTKLITCDDPNGCHWECPLTQNGNKCENTTFTCPSTVSFCNLHCISCENIQIISQSESFTITCTDTGCHNLNITADTPNSNIDITCDAYDTCSDIIFNCPIDENCKCMDNGNNMCIDIRGNYTIQSYTHPSPQSNGNSNAIIIVLSSALMFTLIVCIYLFLSKRKSSANKSQTEKHRKESNLKPTHGKQMDNCEYSSDVNIHVNRLNSIQYHTAKKARKKYTESNQSMYIDGEHNTTNHRQTNKLSNTASEGNMSQYSEGNMDDGNESDETDDNHLLYGRGKVEQKVNEWESQKAPILAFENDLNV